MSTLTERQTEILEWAARGLLDREIAGKIEITPHTVRLHLMAIRKRLKARNTTHAVAIALKHHIITLEDEHDG